MGIFQLRFKDVCKRDTKALDVDVDGWEDLAQDRSRWRQKLNHNLHREGREATAGVR